MKPAIKSCSQRCSDLEKAGEWMKEQLERKDGRIAQLETVLLTHGTQELRAAMQAVISETRVNIDRIGGK
jgi:prefoldin subunit 5